MAAVYARDSRCKLTKTGVKCYRTFLEELLVLRFARTRPDGPGHPAPYTWPNGQSYLTGGKI
ncbi:MAG TPA: hypothetical protein VGP72_02570 [Planctomycetota bacterium]